MNACDARDGVTDGVLNDPRTCSFDVAKLQCKAGDAEDCLTAAQVATARRAYSATKTASGTVVFPGKDPGSETGWGGFVGGQQAPGVSVGSFQVAYQDANWDAKTFDVDRDLKIVDEKVGSIVNAVSPDLRAFKARGGKLLLYHGWNDTAISAGNTIDYYSSVLSRMGGKQDDWHPSVHGARHAALRRRAGTESGELDGRARALARIRDRARSPRRVARHEQPRGHDATAVRVSAGRAVQGCGQHQRRREFR